jgi:hypothetical protein
MVGCGDQGGRTAPLSSRNRLEGGRESQRTASHGGRTALLSSLNRWEGGIESQRAASHSAPLSSLNRHKGGAEREYEESSTPSGGTLPKSTIEVSSISASGNVPKEDVPASLEVLSKSSMEASSSAMNSTDMAEDSEDLVFDNTNNAATPSGGTLPKSTIEVSSISASGNVPKEDILASLEALSKSSMEASTPAMNSTNVTEESEDLVFDNTNNATSQGGRTAPLSCLSRHKGWAEREHVATREGATTELLSLLIQWEEERERSCTSIN